MREIPLSQFQEANPLSSQHEAYRLPYKTIHGVNDSGSSSCSSGQCNYKMEQGLAWLHGSGSGFYLRK